MPTGIVDGTENDDLIDETSVDADGDVVDGLDATRDGEAPDDDIIDALGGDDTVAAGEGDDDIYGGSGSDVIDGGAGDDNIYADGNFAGGVTGTGGREVFKWDLAPDPDDGGEVDEGDDLTWGFSQDTGSVTVSLVTLRQDTGGTTEVSEGPTFADDIDSGSTPADTDSALASTTNGSDAQNWYSLNFSESVENVEFRINDIDNLDQVQIWAFDAAGNQIEVSLSGGSNLGLTDTDWISGNDTATANGADASASDESNSLLVQIAGPVSQVKIVHAQSENVDETSDISITDVYFDGDLVTDDGVDGDDYVDGGDGDDFIEGGDGDDTLIGGDGSDTVEGGGGDDFIDTSGPDGLPDRGFPSYQGLPEIEADPDPFNDRDVVDGGDGDDTIITGDDNDIISGGDGNDTIDGGLDDDDISGDDGDDFIVGGEGADNIDGGDGNDTIYGGLDPIFPDALNILDDGSDGNDPDPDTTNGMDVLDGGAGDDIIYGQDDDDVLFGGEGDDYLDGGIDEDTIYGDEGNDTIIGGQGADTMFGGDDEDTFLIEERSDGDGDVVDGGDGGVDNDTLEIDGECDVDYRVVDVTTDSDGNGFDGTVEFLDSSTGEVTGQMTFTNIENVCPPVCFTPGSLIATPKGERRVEDLRPGDRVITRDNGIQEIAWSDARTLSRSELVQGEHLRPIMIRKGALGNGLPERDMMLSPNHRLLVSNDKANLYFEETEVLVAAKHLTGLDGVEQMNSSQVTYVHFMCENHEVVLSDGSWSESFQPGDQSLEGLGNAQRNEIFELFPDLKTDAGLEAYPSARRSLKKFEVELLMH